jgi:hypothetical protein
LEIDRPNGAVAVVREVRLAAFDRALDPDAPPLTSLPPGDAACGQPLGRLR